MYKRQVLFFGVHRGTVTALDLGQAVAAHVTLELTDGLRGTAEWTSDRSPPDRGFQLVEELAVDTELAVERQPTVACVAEHTLLCRNQARASVSTCYSTPSQ